MAEPESSVEEIVELERSTRDSQADTYDHHLAQRAYHVAVLDACFARVFGDDLGGLAVDVGSGTGRHLPWLLTLSDEVVGVDHSAKSLELARRRVGPEDRGRLRLEVGDLRELPVADGVADRVLCSEVIQHVPSADARSAGMREMYRVLRPGGLVAISGHRWFGRVKTLHRDGFWEGEHGRIYYHLLTAMELRRMMRDAGFAEVRVIRAPAAPSLAERLGVGVDAQCRLAFIPGANLLGHFLVGYGTRPAT